MKRNIEYNYNNNVNNQNVHSVDQINFYDPSLLLVDYLFNPNGFYEIQKNHNVSNYIPSMNIYDNFDRYPFNNTIPEFTAPNPYNVTSFNFSDYQTLNLPSVISGEKNNSKEESSYPSKKRKHSEKNAKVKKKKLSGNEPFVLEDFTLCKLHQLIQIKQKEQLKEMFGLTIKAIERRLKKRGISYNNLETMDEEEVKDKYKDFYDKVIGDIGEVRRPPSSFSVKKVYSILCEVADHKKKVYEKHNVRRGSLHHSLYIEVPPECPSVWQMLTELAGRAYPRNAILKEMQDEELGLPIRQMSKKKIAEKIQKVYKKYGLNSAEIIENPLSSNEQEKENSIHFNIMDDQNFNNFNQNNFTEYNDIDKKNQNNWGNYDAYQKVRNSELITKFSIFHNQEKPVSQPKKTEEIINFDFDFDFDF